MNTTGKKPSGLHSDIPPETVSKNEGARSEPIETNLDALHPKSGKKSVKRDKQSYLESNLPLKSQTSRKEPTLTLDRYALQNTPPLTHAYIPPEPQETSFSEIPGASPITYIPIDPPDTQNTHAHPDSPSSKHTYTPTGVLLSSLPEDMKPPAFDASLGHRATADASQSTKRDIALYARQIFAVIISFFKKFKQNSTVTDNTDISAAASHHGKKKRTWRQSRKERRRRRIWFEELLAWIFVPLIIFCIYLSVVGIISLFGKTPQELFDGIMMLLKDLKK